jgi:D-arabinose 1-dehydrogenase-like Zn-dependent alcohol dehydrogenase
MSYDGGYADYMIAPTEAVASIPDELSATEAAPMMCAGVTTYNALRNSGAREGEVVAIFGVVGVRAMIQVFPLESAAEAFDLMMNGKARFRAVLTTGH